MHRSILLAGALILSAFAVEAQQPPAAAGKTPAVPIPDFPTDSLGRLIFSREVYGYPGDGRRDPFASLIATGDIRPLFDDLRLSGIIVDMNPRNSVAMLKDISTQELYRARVGSVFGRLRVVFIRAGEVGLAIDEFGFTRQEVLTFTVPSSPRTP